METDAGGELAGCSLPATHYSLPVSHPEQQPGGIRNALPPASPMVITPVPPAHMPMAPQAPAMVAPVPGISAMPAPMPQPAFPVLVREDVARWGEIARRAGVAAQ